MDKRTPEKAKKGLLENMIIKLMPQSFSLLQRSQSSVEIHQTPKGIVEFTVKCYADSIEEAQANGLKSFMDLKLKIDGQGGQGE